jgi:hypothetical protein
MKAALAIASPRTTARAGPALGTPAHWPSVQRILPSPLPVPAQVLPGMAAFQVSCPGAEDELGQCADSEPRKW